jgi:Dyp-type peroxidase family
MTRLDWADIQGFVLRGYPLKAIRYFVLRVINAAAARAFLGQLTNASGGGPHLTTAADWAHVQPLPETALNLGITWPGLLALGADALPGFAFKSFPAFVAGSANRAGVVGDTGDSAPADWVGGLGSGMDHVLLAFHAADVDHLDAATGPLGTLWGAEGAFALLHTFTGNMLPGGRVHFGYRDGIAQPTIEGGMGHNTPDAQPPSPAWNFVLLDDPAAPYDLPSPVELGRNGSFGVFRVLRQDVAAFERFLDANAGAIDRELLAAKLCGRWRNGVPLVLSPDTDSPARPIPEDGLNNFDYVPSADNASALDDQRGERCPIGAHTRRLNPRGQTVQGGGGHHHRIVRRGIPYGPAYDPLNPDDVEERGLLGFFISASIENQFEFLMSAWVNSGGFAAGLPADETDPLTGDHGAGAGFTIPQTAPRTPLKLAGFARFVTTRGGAYCFLPSVTALRRLAAL